MLGFAEDQNTTHLLRRDTRHCFSKSNHGYSSSDDDRGAIISSVGVSSVPANNRTMVRIQLARDVQSLSFSSALLT